MAEYQRLTDSIYLWNNIKYFGLVGLQLPYVRMNCYTSSGLAHRNRPFNRRARTTEQPNVRYILPVIQPPCITLRIFAV